MVMFSGEECVILFSVRSSVRLCCIFCQWFEHLLFLCLPFCLLFEAAFELEGRFALTFKNCGI